jgi:hypothetical protein
VDSPDVTAREPTGVNGHCAIGRPSAKNTTVEAAVLNYLEVPTPAMVRRGV